MTMVTAMTMSATTASARCVRLLVANRLGVAIARLRVRRLGVSGLRSASGALGSKPATIPTVVTNRVHAFLCAHAELARSLLLRSKAALARSLLLGGESTRSLLGTKTALALRSLLRTKSTLTRGLLRTKAPLALRRLLRTEVTLARCLLRTEPALTRGLLRAKTALTRGLLRTESTRCLLRAKTALAGGLARTKVAFATEVALAARGIATLIQLRRLIGGRAYVGTGLAALSTGRRRSLIASTRRRALIAGTRRWPLVGRAGWDSIRRAGSVGRAVLGERDLSSKR